MRDATNAINAPSWDSRMAAPRPRRRRRGEGAAGGERERCERGHQIRSPARQLGGSVMPQAPRRQAAHVECVGGGQACSSAHLGGAPAAGAHRDAQRGSPRSRQQHRPRPRPRRCPPSQHGGGRRAIPPGRPRGRGPASPGWGGRWWGRRQTSRRGGRGGGRPLRQRGGPRGPETRPWVPWDPPTRPQAGAPPARRARRARAPAAGRGASLRPPPPPPRASTRTPRAPAWPSCRPRWR